MCLPLFTACRERDRSLRLVVIVSACRERDKSLRLAKKPDLYDCRFGFLRTVP